MKRFRLMTLAVLSTAVLLSGCKDPIDPVDDSLVTVGEFAQSDLVSALSDMYAQWEENTTIPTSLTVAGKSLSSAELVWAEAQLIQDLSAGTSAKVTVKSPKAATNPDRDSYDAETIKVKDGAADGKGTTEDLVTVASSILSAAKEKGQIPNQTLFYRGSEAIAYSTNRAIITIARAVSEYKSAGKLPAEVSTEYLSAAATLKGFAQQYVTYLDVWENTIGTLSADGSHCSDLNTAWEKVHFIPVPHSGGAYADGKDQYDPKYQPYHTIEVAGVTYTAAEAFTIAMKAIMMLCTKEGPDVLQSEMNTPVHTLADGKSLSAKIPAVPEWAIWGNYPWYEKADDEPYAFANTEVSLEYIIRDFGWRYKRCVDLGKIGNFICFDDGTSYIHLDPYKGTICPMRMMLVSARFFKYLLDNNITENVYSAMKDVMISADLYNQVPPKVAVDQTSLSFGYEQEIKSVTVTSTVSSWEAKADVDWLTLAPVAGDKLSVMAAANTGSAREATITVTAEDESATISVKQEGAPVAATIKDFAEQYVTILNVWASTTGTINYLTGEAAGEAANDNANAHYVPEATTITVGGKTLSTADMLEIAERSYLLLRGYDGNWTEGYGAAKYTDRKLAGSTMATAMPSTHSYKWGGSPYNETGSTSAGNVVTSNGGNLKMGDPQTADGVDKVKLDILDNFAFRHTNWPITKGAISNMCGYASGQLDGYYGCFSAKRALLTYAWFFKYMLDNNLSDATAISADQTFKTDLFGYNETPSSEPTLKDFATEFVKCLDVWSSTVGTVDADGLHCTANNSAWQNVHFVPITNPNNIYGTEGNQYDPKYTPFTVKVGDKTYTSAQCWEIAIRGLMNLCTSEGEEFLPTMDNRNKAYTLANNGSLSTEKIPAYSEKCEWGKTPWYEYDNTVTYNSGTISTVDVNFLIKCGSWHIVRAFIKTGGNSSPLNMIGNFQEFGTSASQLQLEGYAGLICPMREFLIAARIYKYILDNNIDGNVYDAIKDKQFAFDLY